jgi:adenylate cyclase
MNSRLHISNSITGEQSDFELTLAEVPIGRSRGDNVLVLSGDKVSRRHAVLRLSGSSYVVLDLESANGTYVNGHLIHETTLADSDTISIGPYQMVYSQAAPAVRFDSRQLGQTVMLRAPDRVLPDLPDRTRISLDSSTKSLLEEIETLRQKAERLAHIYELNELLSSVLSLDEIFKKLGEMIFRLTPADRFLVLRADAATDGLTIVFSKFSEEQNILSGHGIWISKTVLDIVLKDRVTLLSSDTQTDGRLALAQSLIFQNVHSTICAPLLRGGRILGVIYVDCHDPTKVFTADHLDLLNALASATSMAVDNATSHERLMNEALARAAYGRFMPQHIVSQILADPHSIILGGVNQVVTILFADIRGFTTMSERLAPETVVQVLNEFFEEMTPIVFEQGGILDKYIGDAMMALFGVPRAEGEPALGAVFAATEMQRRMVTLNQELKRRGLPEIAVGIGINTGEVTVGYIGSKQRTDYTAIGDAVNLAARLEKKASGGQIVMSQSTFDSITTPIATKPGDKILVKGRQEPVQTYEVLWD